jgi:hypothetical protein
MRQVVRAFTRTTEPSFPDNDALPKKGEEDNKFDKRFNEWYDDVKINLDRVQDQLTTFYQTDINESIDTQKKVTSEVISSVNQNLITTIQELNKTLLDAKNTLQSVQGNLYSE